MTRDVVVVFQYQVDETTGLQAGANRDCDLVQPVGLRNRMDGVEAQSIEAKFVQPVV
jgi:hypothetical protein